MQVHRRTLVFILAAGVLGPTILRAAGLISHGPSFDCKNVRPGTPEGLICYTPELAEQDLEMAKLYQQLIEYTAENEKETRREEQRQWIKNRANSCSPIADAAQYKCHEAYKNRITILRNALFGVWVKKGDRSIPLCEREGWCDVKHLKTLSNEGDHPKKEIVMLETENPGAGGPAYPGQHKEYWLITWSQNKVKSTRQLAAFDDLYCEEPGCKHADTGIVFKDNKMVLTHSEFSGRMGYDHFTKDELAFSLATGKKVSTAHTDGNLVPDDDSTEETP